MRIDKYLWAVRLFKTRSLALENIRTDRVFIGDVAVKAARETKIGDTILIKKHGYQTSFKVLDIPKSRVGAKLVAQYMVDQTLPEEYEKRDFLLLAKASSRLPGTGRPTKKDRRDLEEFGT